MKSAAENLTPVLLELGGKSPLIIDKNVNLSKALPRIIWGKFVNSGQTCIAPDYALVHQDKYDEFLIESIKVIEKFWTSKPQTSPDYRRIINERHVQRVKKLLESSGKIHYGGKIDETDRYISPTIITDPNPDSLLMRDEIFGPLFPILSIKSVDQAVQFVNGRPKPLVLYIFTDDTSMAEKVIESTSSGGVCVNETLLHNFCRELPFGGVGESGMGAYNGKFSFDEFSHSKAVLERSLLVDPSLRYPPYDEKKLSRMRKLMAFGHLIPLLKKVGIGFIVLLVAYIVPKWIF